MRTIGRMIISTALAMILLGFLFGIASSLLAVWFVW